jgi:polyhydroxybutyrate depolymerase
VGGGGAGRDAGGVSGSGGSAGSAGKGGTAGGAGASADAGGGTAGVGGSAGASSTDGGPGSSGCGKAGRTGAFQDTMTAFGLQRGYYLSVPATYDPMVKQRLVFGYHGSNYTGMKMRTYLTLEQAPLLNGTIFVYPDGLPLPNQADNIAWVLTADGRDIAFFDELYAKLSAEYCIDTDRVFVNGQSFGGLMTNAVGCLRGNVVRAIAVVAGSGPRSMTCQGQVAAWLTHGTDDDSVPFASGEASRDYWLGANHCTTMTTTTDPPQCLNYQGCDSGHPVIWCPHTADGGHQHPSFGRAAVRAFLAGF